MTAVTAPPVPRYMLDLVERVVATFVEGALGSLPVTMSTSTNLRATEYSMIIGGLSAVAALVKGLLAKRVGAGGTAALLSLRADTPKEAWGTSLKDSDPPLAAWLETGEIPVGPRPVPGTGGPATVRPRPSLGDPLE